MAQSSRLVDRARTLDGERPTEIVRKPLSISTGPSVEFGRVVKVTDGRAFVVVNSLGAQPQPARRLVSVSELEPDDDVLIALVGEARTVVILGRLFDASAPSRDVRVNGRRISVEADSELILKCASATIRIGRDGLVAVRGDRVTTQARGSNRIRGGSVEIN